MINLPLSSDTWDIKEREAIQSVLDSNVFTMGKQVASYEKSFSRFFGAKYTVMTSSGSAANLLMIAALFYTKIPKLKKSDEIIVPSIGWSTTFFPLQQMGLKVKFVDVDKETLNFDVKKLAEAISSDTKAILAVNILGNPNDFDAIKACVNGKDIIVLEDNCESMGAVFQDQKAGTFGLMGTFSSFFSHHIATMEGGCVVTDDEELFHVLLCLRAHGWTRDLPKHNLVTGTKSDDPFEESFKFVLPGYNVRPLELSGAIGIEQLKKLPDFVSSRRDNGARFLEVFSNNEIYSVQKELGLSSWFGFAMIIKEGANVSRREVVAKLTENGVECRPIVTGNFLNNEVIKFFDYEVSGNLDNANHIDKHGFFIGNSHNDLKKEIYGIKNVLGG
jgi:dTDP-4-amino-4,6-dideoxygalactose transaminase